MRKLESTYDHPSCGNIPLERQADSLKENDLLSHKITIPAFQHLKANLEKYGNVLTPGQEDVLLGTLRAYTDMAQGKIQGRYAIPLPTGFGKTQSITSWIYQLYKSGIKDTSVAICATKVEELCSIKRQLLDEGVPDNYVGLYHSYKYNREKAEAFINKGEPLPQGYASLPATDPRQRNQILLVTHQRVKGYTGVNRYNVYKGRVRDLVIWDESLFVAESFGVDFLKVEAALKAIETWAKRKPLLEPAVKYLVKCVDILNKESNAQADGKVVPEILKMPELQTEEIEKFNHCLDNTKDCPVRIEPLTRFLKISQAQFRVYYDERKNDATVITSELKVAEEMSNLIVLDASHSIRMLSQGNARHINEADEEKPYINLELAQIDYSNVTVHHLKRGSGRNSVSKVQSSSKLEKRLYSLEVADLVKNFKKNEGVLIFTFKTRNQSDTDHVNILKNDMGRMGIKVDEMIELNNGEIKPRIVFLTWGQETALNQFCYCKNIIFSGVLHRSTRDLSAQIVGEKCSLTADIDKSILSEALDTELSHYLYQAISRGNSRRLNKGVACKSNVYLILSKDRAKRVKELLTQVMPKLRWKSWNGKHLTNDPTKQEMIKDSILEFLKSYSGKSIAISRLKKELDMVHSKDTFTKGLNSALDETREWVKSNRSLVRS